MDIRFRIVAIAVGIIAVVVLVATFLLPRKARLALYTAGIVVAAGVWGYVTWNSRVLPSKYALEPFVSGLIQPTLMLPEPASDRMVILEKAGTIKIAEDGAVLDEPFLDITDRVISDGGEQGLLSMAFDPAYEQNGFFYLYYTVKPDDATVLARYSVSSEDPLRADPESEERWITIPQPDTHHNGGHLQFGPDSYLYLSVGDGGAKDFPGTAQDLSVLLGSVLRIDPTAADGSLPYTIPEDNPFVDQSDAMPEIWAYGLRQPWRFDFDEASGDLYIADVGAQEIEEINYLPAGDGAGKNFGWRYYEGSKATRDDDGYPPEDSFVFPVEEYTHLTLGGCSVTGGYVYHGDALPDLSGKYLYSDYCSGYLWTLEVDDRGRADVERLLRAEGRLFASFGEDHQGNVYLIDIAGGTIYKLVES